MILFALGALVGAVAMLLGVVVWNLCAARRAATDANAPLTKYTAPYR